MSFYLYNGVWKRCAVDGIGNCFESIDLNFGKYVELLLCLNIQIIFCIWRNKQALLVKMYDI